jgi:Flp pilus assembly protein protease CpaA
MFKNIYLMICLIFLSYKDIKSRSVPVIWLILIGAGIPVIYVYDYMINGNVPDYIRLIIAAVIMALLVVVSVFNRRGGRNNNRLCLLSYGCICSGDSRTYIVCAACGYRRNADGF